MRLGTLILILMAMLYGSSFWYRAFDGGCNTPLHYRIGEVDERFGTSRDELAQIGKRAEAVWETPLSKELFVFDPDQKSLPINFIFDERQAESDKEAEIRADLAAKEGMSESVSTQYEKLISEFRTSKKQYESRVVSYETSLKKYNTEVTEWNDKGGAPENIIATFRVEKVALEKEQKALEVLSKKLSSIVTDLNRIGARGNELITDYNSIVETYNAEFGTAREFAQGEYTHDTVNVYEFKSEDELTIVLAHELGHAIGLNHVENTTSIMYHLMGEQTLTRGLTLEDKREVTQACEKKTIRGSVSSFIKTAFSL